jgi:hypothetical protein
MGRLHDELTHGDALGRGEVDGARVLHAQPAAPSMRSISIRARASGVRYASSPSFTIGSWPRSGPAGKSRPQDRAICVMVPRPRCACLRTIRGRDARQERSHMHGRMARYTYSGDVGDLTRRAEQGMLPVFEAQPGFRAYSLIRERRRDHLVQRLGLERAGRGRERRGQGVDRGEHAGRDRARGDAHRRDPPEHDARRDFRRDRLIEREAKGSAKERSLSLPACGHVY